MECRHRTRGARGMRTPRPEVRHAALVEATAASYFGGVPKARMLEVIRETVSPDAAATLAKLKKAALTQAAERELAKKGWLPAARSVA